MPEIHVLDDITINKIAAGEVVEKPMAVIKELVENAIDANSTAVTVEIKNGGLDMMRITDNGCGIASSEIEHAFFRHATSKIKRIEDLDSLESLGFRGEALASIASVAMVECISKTKDSLTGTMYVIEGGKEVSKKEIGCPDGTTFVVKNLFYNTPARRKFLKSPVTEGSYINDLLEKMALSHPDIAFKFINNGKVKLQTSGNGKLRDVIYNVFGRDITANIVEFEFESEYINAKGYIGKPVISKGNRTFMNYFVNGRYVKSPVIYKALEEGYGGFHMSHKYPFCVISFDIDSNKVDVNVHPSKMEIRFSDGDRIYSVLCDRIRNALRNIDVIKTEEAPQAVIYEKEVLKPQEVSKEKKNNPVRGPEPFEIKRMESRSKRNDDTKVLDEIFYRQPQKAEQLSLFERGESAFVKKKDYKIVGCVFATYWIIEYMDDMYIMDQHAAHEKLLYEKLMKQMLSKEVMVQQVSPPIIVTLNPVEAGLVSHNNDRLGKMGFELSHFGGNEYSISGVPAILPQVASKEVFMDIITSFEKENSPVSSESVFLEKLASMSCKAAVKGGKQISFAEAAKLVEDLFDMENPFNCPHGRPTLIKMTKNELEKRFGRRL